MDIDVSDSDSTSECGRSKTRSKTYFLVPSSMLLNNI